MALFLLICRDKPGALEARMAARPDHIAYVRALPAEVLKLGGPILDDAGDMRGSILILDLPDRAAVEAFAAGDPYGLAGVFESVEIEAMRVTVGSVG